MKYLFMALIVIAVAGGAGAWYVKDHADPGIVFRTAEVKRGDLLATIAATGTAEPEEVVDVGAQISGQILNFGKDRNGKIIDYGSQVEAGMVLAQIDASLYAADVNTAKATLLQAQAGVKQAQANLLAAKAAFHKADRDWVRAQKLGPSEALAETDYDMYQSAYETTKAAIDVDEAAILAAQDTVVQDKAMLDKAQQTLDYCTITSPVKGTIVDVRVNIGETVASSLSTPSLFLIAKDFHRMQVWVSVNEADIGSIHPGQPVTYTVDAYPGQTFTGVVGKVRLNAAMTNNVVTYTVEVDTDNSNGKLLPYLTCNVAFEVARHKDVLQVPNAALRWVPARDEIDLAASEASESSSDAEPDSAGSGGSGDSGTAGGSGGSAAATAIQPGATTRPAHKHSGHHDSSQAGGLAGDGTTRGVVWILTQNNLVRPVSVRVGVTDGLNTEIRGKGIQEGDVVVTGEEPRESVDGTTNPFLPQMHHKNSGTH